MSSQPRIHLCAIDLILHIPAMWNAFTWAVSQASSVASDAPQVGTAHEDVYSRGRDAMAGLVLPTVSLKLWLCGRTA